MTAVVGSDRMSPPRELQRMGAALVLAWAWLLPACASLAGGAGGDVDLPNAAAGPFRALRAGELGNARSAPNALEDDDTSPRDASVIDLDGDPATLDVAGYFAANTKDKPAPSPPTTIVRYDAIDARSFDRSAVVVLDAAQGWEGGVLGSPSALRVGQEIWLYYAAAGGVGLARSSDGFSFSREAAPVLAPDAGGWEKGATPRSPGVAVLWDGSFRMFYEIDPAMDGRSVIGEARSDDGITWTRVGDRALLEPSTPPAEGSADVDPPYDSGSVGSPFPVVVTSTAGERILRVYYGAEGSESMNSAGEMERPRVIGLAARFGEDGPLERAVSPVFGADKSLGPREPCALVYEGFSLLFATQRSSLSAETPAVAVGAAPATASLPPPNPL